jgi:LPS-assembly protein
VQRLDFHPRVQIPLFFYGISVTATAGARGTFYSNSIDPTNRAILSQNITRSYGEFELDVRPPALAKDFQHGGAFWFRHVIEPYFVYRKISGVNNFDRVIRFDYVDAVADTNEIEFGVSNRFFTQRSTENVTTKGKGKTPTTTTQTGNRESLASQPYEALTITVRGKYFFARSCPGSAISFIPSTPCPVSVTAACPETFHR